MSAAIGSVFFLVLAVACLACGASTQESDSTTDAVTSASDYFFVAPAMKSGGHYWRPIVLQDPGGFQGTLAFRSAEADGDPDELVVIDKKTGAIAFLAPDSQAPAADWEASRSELGEASRQLTVMAGDPDTGSTRLAAFVNDENKCFIKEASIALALVGAIVAVPLIIEFGPAAIAAGIVSAQEAGAAIAQNGLRTFAVQAGKTALANPTMRKYLAYHVVKTGVKGWLLFSAKGKELTSAVLAQAKEVWKAKCETSPDALEGMRILSTSVSRP